MTLLRSSRASPLSVDDRRAMIVDAVIPLLLEYGRDVTTKQIAESAGIAEGTLFRAFGDKESIIAAAVEKFLDPEPLRMMLRGIDPEDPLERQVHDLIFHLRTRFEGIFGIMAAVGMHGRPPGSDGRAELAELVTAVLSERPGVLRVEASRAASLIRLLALASSIPPFTESAPFTTDELTDLVLHGILQPDPGRD
ncbi:TetR/AcrR family transcriptional regulator [Lacisediminihabitans sp. H27-G8]|uniref:TetR/AcrR family transcriptional regulator n=1 Tax=Lacisediminihabitans sp. H27-G8 TaxID=3111909 RepID=UPI0038FC365B